MTHAEEYENFVAGEEEGAGELCRRCNNYPCECGKETTDEF